MDDKLAAAIYTAYEDSLTALANKGIYKRAVKDAENVQADITETENAAEVTVGGEKCVITAPLGDSTCTCPSRTVCRHIITAILLLKTRLPDDAAFTEKSITAEPDKAEEVPEKNDNKSAKAEKTVKLTKAELEKIRSCAEMCIGLICGVLTHGLVRIPETAAEDFELAAVRCHGAKMAECERMMRFLSGRLADNAARRASFDSRLFTDRLLKTAEHIEHILKDEITPDDLGSFRSVYENVEGSLEILPVGQRTVSGGEYAGEVYYFVNNAPDAVQRFFTFSDLRPTFYETGKKRIAAASPWGLSVPLRSMMKQCMTLTGAKVCEGKLSASKDTMVAAHSPAQLNCKLIHKLMVTDFREIILRLAECKTDIETDRLFFIYPKRMVRYGFDKSSQKLIITFEDRRGCTAECTVKYRSETKSFIEQLERICKSMAGSSGKAYTLLVTAYIEGGRLRFFPVEVYDFIVPTELHSLELPQEAELLAEDGAYAENIERHISSVRDMLTYIVRTGLQSEHDCTSLISESRSLGMEGLAGLLSEMADSAENCRHSLTDGSREVLDKMRKLYRYINAAQERTDMVSALSELEKTSK